MASQIHSKIALNHPSKGFTSQKYFPSKNFAYYSNKILIFWNIQKRVWRAKHIIKVDNSIVVIEYVRFGIPDTNAWCDTSGWIAGTHDFNGYSRNIIRSKAALISRLRFCISCKLHCWKGEIFWNVCEIWHYFVRIPQNAVMIMCFTNKKYFNKLRTGWHDCTFVWYFKIGYQWWIQTSNTMSQRKWRKSMLLIFLLLCKSLSLAFLFVSTLLFYRHILISEDLFFVLHYCKM